MTIHKPDLAIPPFEIVLAGSKDEMQQCFDIRVDVFHHEQKFPLDTEFDDKEELATHLLLRLIPSLTPIGTIRGYLIPQTTDTYKLTRLAVLEDYRKYGFGRKLVEAFHDWVKSDASANSMRGSVIMNPSLPRQIKINCHSQIYAKGFYAKFGYVQEGEEFIEDGDPHQNMVLYITIPPRDHPTKQREDLG